MFAALEASNSAETLQIGFQDWNSWSLSVPGRPNEVRMPPKVTKEVFFEMMRAFPFKRDFARITLDKRTHMRGESYYKPMLDELEVHLRLFGFKCIVVDLTPSSTSPDGKRPVVRDTTKQRLQFTTTITENEDRWVVLPPTKPDDDSYMYGFIYIDPEAGFTFHVGGIFSFDKNGDLHVHEKTGVMLKNRIQRDHLVARLTPEEITRLGEPSVPDWLDLYKNNIGSTTHKIQWGYAYNHIGAYEKALAYLEPAYPLAAKNNKLIFELSYAYNALRRTADAERILVQAIKDLPDDFLVNREYAYLLLHSGKYEKAVVQYKNCIKICPASNMDQKSEVAFNLAQAYKQTGDPQNAAIWFENARQWAPEGSPIANFFKDKSP